MLRKILLICGIVSSVWYVATDVIGTLRYPGYSYADQWFSELTAQGAPTRDFMVALNGIPYTLHVSAFAEGVRTSAAPKRAGRITAAMLIGYAAFGFAGGVLFPMKPREALAAGEGTLRTPAHPCHGGDVTLHCAGRGLRVHVTREALSVLLLRDDRHTPRVRRFDKLAGWPDRHKRTDAMGGD